MAEKTLVFATDTPFGYFEVMDTLYDGRQARVLYSNDREAAQSGIAYDDLPHLLFDYNQRFLELARQLEPKRVLLIGGGAFTLPKAFMAEFPDSQQDIIEINPALYDIAKKYFSFRPSPATHVFIADGRQKLKELTDPYDLILLDVFDHTVVPSSFQTIEAMQSFQRRLRSGGVLAMNIIAGYRGPRATLLRRFVAALNLCFNHVQIFPASAHPLEMAQNYVLVASNRQHHLEDGLPFPPVEPPHTTTADVLRDRDIAA